MLPKKELYYKEKYNIYYERFEKYLPRDVATVKEVEDFLFKCVEEHYIRQKQQIMKNRQSRGKRHQNKKS